MKLVIVSIALMLFGVNANPTPQIFGYQPATPVGQWVSNNLQNSLQTVANAIQSISRPSQPIAQNPQVVQVGPNQIPNGPDNYGLVQPVQAVVQPVPVQTISVQPYQPGVYQPGVYQPGVYQPGPYQPSIYQQGPYEQIHVIPVPPPNAPWPNSGVPYRKDPPENEMKAPNWIPLPMYSQFGEPTVIIISRPAKPAPKNETVSQDSMNQPINSTNSSNMDADHSTTNFPQNEQTLTSTPVPTPNYGTTSMFSPETGFNVPELGLSMVNRVPITSSEMPGHESMPNTN